MGSEGEPPFLVSLAVNKHGREVDISIGERGLEQLRAAKVLGLYRQNLTWDDHEEFIAKKISSGLLALSSTNTPAFPTKLTSGGVAGISVDIALFPLDTLKTRLQCPKGFLQSGGFKNLYKGLGPAAAGSAPSAALFFCTYNTCKKTLKPYVAEQYHPFLHMFAASMGELASCIVKVPTEIFKQRQQACIQRLTTFQICKSAYANEGFLGFYRGFGSTVLREVPFSIVQLPIWELLKKHLHAAKKQDLNPFEVSLCGAIAGGISAAVTTPLDVAKTRIMLTELDPKKVDDCKKLRIGTMLGTIYREAGVKGLFAGFIPRVTWITIGGAIFFGIYEASREFLVQFYLPDQ